MAMMAVATTAASSYSLTRGVSRRNVVFCSSGGASKSWRPLLGRRSSINGKKNDDKIEAVPQRRLSGKGKQEKLYLSPGAAKEELGQTKPAAFKSPGLQKKDRKEFSYNLNDQQAYDMGDLQDTAFLNAVVKTAAKWLIDEDVQAV